MFTKKVRESYVSTPWGKIAIISWGNPEKPPILLMHGYLDTAATFTFLVEKLPDKYNYVGFDIPGHGKSDPFPPGILITKVHVVEAIRLLVQHLEWTTFTLLSHSMSCIIAILYNTFYPGNIEKMIFLDPKPALAWYPVINHHKELWYKLSYSHYYENYQKINFSKPKSQTYKSWISSLARVRNLTEEQCGVVLSRSLIKTENDAYQLSWEPRAKLLTQVGIPIATLSTIIAELPLTLVLNASEYVDFVKVAGSKEGAEKIMKDCEHLPQFRTVTVKSGHDMHITNPELIAEYIEDFMKSDNKYVKKSKL